MTKLQTKMAELEHAQAFVRLMPELGVGELQHLDKPDFRLVLAGGRTVGLEHVRAVDQSIAAGEGAVEKINERVLAGLVATRVNASVVVSIDDGAAAVLATRDMKAKLAAEIDAIVRLAKVALGNAPSKLRHQRRRASLGIDDPPTWRRFQHFRPDITLDDMVCWRDPNREYAYDLDGRGVDFATAITVRPDDEPNVGRGGSSWGQPPSIIQDAIDKKAAKLEDYRDAGYQEQWLLVVGSAATGGTLDLSAADREFTSPYDRTFFLETFADECAELSTVCP